LQDASRLGEHRAGVGYVMEHRNKNRGVEALVGNRELFCGSSNGRQALLRGKGKHLGRAVDHDRLPTLLL
jgi:hypothetical protein